MNTETQTATNANGRIDSLHLGVFSMDQVASLINWGNESDYEAPQRVPWVMTGRPDGSNVAAPTPVAPPAEPPTAQAEATPAAQATPAQAEQTETVPTETSDAAPAAHAEETTPQPVDTEASSQADQQTASEPVASANEAPIAEQPDSESPGADQAEAIQSETQHERAGDVAQATDERTDQHSSEEAGTAPQAAGTEPAQQSPADGVTDETSAGTSNVASQAPVPRKPIASPPKHIKAVSQPPAAMSTTNSTRQPVSEDYLSRLETLVLALNEQIARHNSDGANQELDYTQWLGQRVIDLSLENMALQEELQKHR